MGRWKASIKMKALLSLHWAHPVTWLTVLLAKEERRNYKLIAIALGMVPFDGIIKVMIYLNFQPVLYQSPRVCKDMCLIYNI